MNRQAATAVVVGVAVIALATTGLVVSLSGVVSASTTSGSPDLNITALEPSATVSPGETAEVELQVSNTGRVDSGSVSATIRDTLTTAQNVRIDVDSEDNPFNVRDSMRSIGSVDDAQPVTLDGGTSPSPLLLEVPEDVEPGTYEVDVTLEYRHPAQVRSFEDGSTEITNDAKRSEDETITIEVYDGPRFEFVDAQTSAPVGDSGSITTDIRNIGEDTANDITVELQSGSQRVSFGGATTESAGIDQLEPGETATLEYDLRFGERASVRAYPLEATITYDDSEGIEGVDDRPSVHVTPNERESFDIEDVESTLQVGEEGSLVGTVYNTGSTTVGNAVVDVAQGSENVASSEAVAVGTLEPGEFAEFELPITISSDAEAVRKEIDLAVRYRNSENEQRLDERVSAVAPIDPEQQFVVDEVESTLRVGEDGDLVGTVTNTGPESVRSIVVEFTDESETITPVESQYAVGSLDSGESAQFRLPLEVSDESEAIPKALDLAVRYRNDQNELRTYEEVNALADVGERRDEFLVSVQDRDIQAGSSILIDVEVTNNLDEEVSDIEAKLFTSDPLDSEDDEGYAASLAPGESTTITFEVNAEGGAVTKTHPISMDFRYDDADGRSQVSDTTRVAMQVTESQDSGLPLPLIGGIVIVVAIAGGLLYRNRDE